METMTKAYNVPGAHVVITKGDHLTLHRYLTNIAMGFMTVPNKKMNVDETVIYYNSDRTWDQILVDTTTRHITNAKLFVNRIKGKKDVIATKDLFTHDDPIRFIRNRYKTNTNIRAIVIDLKVIETAAISTTKLKRLIDFAWGLQVPVIIGIDCTDYPLSPFNINNGKWSSQLKSEFLSILEDVQSLHYIVNNRETLEIYPYKNRAFKLDYYEMDDVLYV